jgi:hypothetical protein
MRTRPPSLPIRRLNSQKKSSLAHRSSSKPIGSFWKGNRANLEETNQIAKLLRKRVQKILRGTENLLELKLISNHNHNRSR